MSWGHARLEQGVDGQGRLTVAVEGHVAAPGTVSVLPQEQVLNPQRDGAVNLGLKLGELARLAGALVLFQGQRREPRTPVLSVS